MGKQLLQGMEEEAQKSKDVQICSCKKNLYPVYEGGRAVHLDKFGKNKYQMVFTNLLCHLLSSIPAQN